MCVRYTLLFNRFCYVIELVFCLFLLLFNVVCFCYSLLCVFLLLFNMVCFCYRLLCVFFYYCSIWSVSVTVCIVFVFITVQYGLFLLQSALCLFLLLFSMVCFCYSLHCVV